VQTQEGGGGETLKLRPRAPGRVDRRRTERPDPSERGDRGETLKLRPRAPGRVDRRRTERPDPSERGSDM
jgi:hypothetical protein